MKGKWSRYVQVSRSAVALAVVTIAGGMAMFVFDSTQAENAIQIGTNGAMAVVVIRSLNRAEGVVNAALRLAAELARKRSGKSGPPEDGLAPVVPLPTQRTDRSERSEAS